MHRLINEVVRNATTDGTVSFSPAQRKMMTHLTNVCGHEDLSEAFVAYQRSPNPPQALHLLATAMRMLEADRPKEGPAAIAVSNVRDATLVATALQQCWVDGQQLPTVADVDEFLVSERVAPSLLVVGTDISEDPSDVVLRFTADLELSGTHLVVVTEARDPGEHAHYLSLGAALVVGRDQLHTQLFSEMVGAMLGVVQGVNLAPLEDPVTHLATADALQRGLEHAIEDYGTFRSNGWTLVAVRVTNHRHKGTAGGPELIERAAEQFQMLFPPEVIVGRMSYDTFGAVVRDEQGLDWLDEIAAPLAPLGFMAQASGPDPEWVAAAVHGGSVMAEEALRRVLGSLNQATTRAPAEITPIGQKRAYQVLVVEDDPTAALYVSKVLDRAGMSAVRRADGMAGLEEFRRNGPAYVAVVLDLQMPKMDGIEVLQAIRTGSIQPDVPVLVLTASDEERHEFLSLQLGAGDFIQKPVSPEILLARLRRLIRPRLDTDASTPIPV